jgi:hypothetical protein
MPTNRPFFANFLAAFRAHSSPAYKATSSTSPTALASPAHVSTTSSTATSTTATSNARSIATKATSSTSQPSNPSSSSPSNASNALASAAAVVAASSHIHHVSPLSRSPGVSTPHNMSMSPPGGASTPLSRGRQRRGSDSSNSSGGFIDAVGPEKWYIGGRTAAGEEKFYRLGLVTGAPGRRVRSLDRLSL